MGFRLDPRVKNRLDHLWGPIVGVVFTILIVVVLVKFMVFEAKEKQSEIEVTLAEPVETDLEEFEEDLEMLENCRIWRMFRLIRISRWKWKPRRKLNRWLHLQRRS